MTRSFVCILQWLRRSFFAQSTVSGDENKDVVRSLQKSRQGGLGGRDGKFVRLVKDNDSVVNVPLDRLSSNDMAYVLQLPLLRLLFACYW